MLWDAPPPQPSPGREVVKAAAIAGLSAVATGLATWAIEELKARVKETKKGPDQT